VPEVEVVTGDVVDELPACRAHGRRRLDEPALLVVDDVGDAVRDAEHDDVGVEAA
jgi:hypothetical protein